VHEDFLRLVSSPDTTSWVPMWGKRTFLPVSVRVRAVAPHFAAHKYGLPYAPESALNPALKSRIADSQQQPTLPLDVRSPSSPLRILGAQQSRKCADRQSSGLRALQTRFWESLVGVTPHFKCDTTAASG
jgi:hypothetical protein